jgi:hypothetical protein
MARNSLSSPPYTQGERDRLCTSYMKLQKRYRRRYTVSQLARRTTSHQRQEGVWAWSLIGLVRGREVLIVYGDSL